MPRYLIERTLGDIDREALLAAGEHSADVREEQFPDILWEHSHILRGEGGLTSYCIYRADDPERIRAHAEAAGLPFDRIHEIETDLGPDGPVEPVG